MTRSTDCRVLVTAVRRWAGQPETEIEMAAPVLTDPNRHRAPSGPHKSADGSRAISVAWTTVRS